MSRLDELHQFYDGPVPPAELRYALGHRESDRQAEQRKRDAEQADRYAAHAAEQWREAKALLRVARRLPIFSADRRRLRNNARVALEYVAACRDNERYWRALAGPAVPVAMREAAE